MKQRLLALFLSFGFLASQGQVDPAYQQVALERAEKIVAEIAPSLQTDKKPIVRDLVADQYTTLHAIHAERDRQLAEDGGNRDKILAHVEAVVASQHKEYVSKLQKLLTVEQVEGIKNGMTYYTVPKTYNNYLLMLPFATDEELAMILENLTEAREHAMDGGSAKEKHAWFNKYKGRIANALAAGNRVELRGFGAFSVKNRPARTGRNPRTGESVDVEEKWVPFFKTGKELRERLNIEA